MCVVVVVLFDGCWWLAEGGGERREAVDINRRGKEE